ncbi:cache domain-containing protein [Marinomonas communis]|uniref:cache domain-containing protein n=1 Tax=Marinomonas communis TaxID=28254 RepID=UPI00105F2351|nr:cache domain-containing protein [Marinomonas communis]
MIGLDVSLNKLTEVVQKVHFGQDGYLILIEDTGVILADSNNLDNNFKPVQKLAGSYQTLFTALEQCFL